MALRLALNRVAPRLFILQAAVLAGLLLGLPQAVAAQTNSQAAPQQNVQVIITDVGFSPKSVTIYTGEIVQWLNVSYLPHTVTQEEGQSYGLNSGGINAGSCPIGTGWSQADCQRNSTFQFVFSKPGTYYYTSAIDCLFGNRPTDPDFDCSPASVTVLPGPPPGVSASAAPAPVPAATATPSPIFHTANVTITDSGFSPSTVTVAVGGTVIWTNLGNNVHNARPVPGGNEGLFDSGGLANGQSFGYSFNQPGTYVYTSYADCGPAGTSDGFQCGYFAVNVTPTAPTLASNPPPVPPATAVAAPTPLPTGVPSSDTNITIDDQNGFTPTTLTIKVGQTVTWTNKGSAVHSAVSNWASPSLWYLPPAVGLFDSGGLGPGQQFSFTFTQAGVYNYHSSTEPIVTNSTNFPGNAITTYQFNAVINVLP